MWELLVLMPAEKLMQSQALHLAGALETCFRPPRVRNPVGLSVEGKETAPAECALFFENPSTSTPLEPPTSYGTSSVNANALEKVGPEKKGTPKKCIVSLPCQLNPSWEAILHDR